MNPILRLYPKAWRERYGDELVALLEDRPASLADHLDLIRGALDARLHPQIRGAGAPPEQEIPVTQRSLGLVAAIGGVAFIIAIASMLVLPRDAEGSRDISVAVFALALGIALIGTALGELGTRPNSPTSATTGHVVAVLGFLFGALLVMGWPMILVGIMGFAVLVIAATLRGTRNGVIPGWLATVFVISDVAFFLAAMGQNTRDGELGPILLGSMGLAALALAWLAITRHVDGPKVTAA